MQKALSVYIGVDVERSVLSAFCRLHKTERFIKETEKFKDIDTVLSKLAEGIILKFPEIEKKLFSSPQNLFPYDCFKIETDKREHTFFFKMGFQLGGTGLSKRDLVFFKYVGMEKVVMRNNAVLINYLKQRKKFNILLSSTTAPQIETDFKKLYRLSNTDYVNFPLLNAQQRKIVTTEDQNMLVQGVAGSGKTNVCIDKIVYSACREYSGRVLYSTFSRGLLIDTQGKVDIFRKNLLAFVDDFENNRVVFVDNDHKKAIENKLGVYFSVEDDDKICEKIKRIASFLEHKVDYFLPEDLYNKYIGEKEGVVGESYFIKDYISDIKNHQLTGKLSKIKYLSFEVIYKEIYGMIFGCYDLNKPKAMLTLEEYTERRKDSFNKSECEIIYQLARDYAEDLRRKRLTDNNLISRRLLEKQREIGVYSIIILDEVQDMTEVNLCLMKKIGRKLFCVGDALQMINPSYFSFAYLKRLLFEKDVVSVSELANNYRNTRRIAEIIESLEQINVKQFGTHSFVVKGESVDSEIPTSAVFLKEQGLMEGISKRSFDNFTIIVNGAREKEKLRKLLKTQEILTVSEIKGLEREVVVLYNVLSDNFDKWGTLQRTLVNRKQADENSVYRYYFNLFYVGVSRAKAHLYVVEEKEIPLFSEFFKNNFAAMTQKGALESLSLTVSKIEIEQDELVERVRQFINLEQYDNARFTAQRIADDRERNDQFNKIAVYEKYVSHGNYREAGIAFWEFGLNEEAKRQFSLSGDESLSNLVDACAEGDSGSLNIDIIRFYTEVEKNEVAKKLIIQTIKKDFEQISATQNEIRRNLKKMRSGK